MDGYKLLAAEIIKTAVDDYRQVESAGCVKNGKLDLRPLTARIAEDIAFKHRKKSLDYTMRKLRIAEIAGGQWEPDNLAQIVAKARKKKRHAFYWPMNDAITITDAASAHSFLRTRWFVDLCQFVNVSPDAVRERLGDCKRKV